MVSWDRAASPRASNHDAVDAPRFDLTGKPCREGAPSVRMSLVVISDVARLRHRFTGD
jgi:hypothetical protein